MLYALRDANSAAEAYLEDNQYKRAVAKRKALAEARRKQIEIFDLEEFPGE
jgi:hypothetical protein